MESPRFVLELIFKNSRVLAELPTLLDLNIFSRLLLSEEEDYDSFFQLLLDQKAPIGCFFIEEGKLLFESSPWSCIETSFNPSFSSLIFFWKEEVFLIKSSLLRCRENIDFGLIKDVFVEQLKLFSRGQLIEAISLENEEIETLREKITLDDSDDEIEEFLCKIFGPNSAPIRSDDRKMISNREEVRTEKKPFNQSRYRAFETPEGRLCTYKSERNYFDNLPTSSKSENFDCCSICLNPFNLVKATLSSCSHEFCFKCIKEWSRITNRCPLCKIPFLKIKKRGQMVRVSPKEQSREDQRGFLLPVEPISENNCYCCSLTSFVSNPLLVCESCNVKTCHMLCLDPPLTFISAEPWYCDFCVEENQIRNVLPVAGTTQIVSNSVIKKRLLLLRQTINGEPAELGLGIDGEPLRIKNERSIGEISPPRNRGRSRRNRDRQRISSSTSRGASA